MDEHFWSLCKFDKLMLFQWTNSRPRSSGDMTQNFMDEREQKTFSSHLEHRGRKIFEISQEKIMAK